MSSSSIEHCLIRNLLKWAFVARMQKRLWVQLNIRNGIGFSINGPSRTCCIVI